MLECIHLQNFKSSKDLTVPLAPLTILSGLNSSGKSSVLQALAIIRQSYFPDTNRHTLRLSGDLVQLGRFEDVLTEDALGDNIVFSVTEGKRTASWKMQGALDDTDLSFSPMLDRPLDFAVNTAFQFLQADRMAPDTLYPQLPQSSRMNGFLGSRGEFTAGFLASAGTRSGYPSRRCSLIGIGMSRRLIEQTSPTNNLLDQASGWLQQISPGVVINQPQNIVGTDAVSMQFAFTGKKEIAKSAFYRPTNVGFGLSYSLPIIVACLAAEPGSLLLLENPEAHLHPQGQAAMGHLLSQCVQDGVQIVVETHSDHLVNGVRLAVKGEALNPDLVALHLFSRDVITGYTKIQSPKLYRSGRISSWPEGFFDQWDKDTDALID